jgi:hypothetical protein
MINPPDNQITSQKEQLLSVSFGQSNGLVNSNDSKFARGFSVQDGLDHNAQQATSSSELPGLSCTTTTEALSTSISEHPSPSSPFPYKPLAPSTDLPLSQEKQMLLQENTFSIQPQAITSDDSVSKELSSPIHVPSIQRPNIEVSDATSLVAPIRHTNGTVADRSQPIRCIPEMGSPADIEAPVAGLQNTLVPSAPPKSLSLKTLQLGPALSSVASRPQTVPSVPPDAIVSKPAAPYAHRSDPDALYHVVDRRRLDRSERLHNSLSDTMSSVSDYHKSPNDDTKAAYDCAFEKLVSVMGSELDAKKRPQFMGLNLNKDLHLHQPASQPSNGALVEQIFDFCNNPYEEEVESDTILDLEAPLKTPRHKSDLFVEPELTLGAPTAAPTAAHLMSRPTICDAPAGSRSSGGERRDALFHRLLGHQRPHPHCYTTGVYPASRQLEPCHSYCEPYGSERARTRYLAKLVRTRVQTRTGII